MGPDVFIYALVAHYEAGALFRFHGMTHYVAVIILGSGLAVVVAEDVGTGYHACSGAGTVLALSFLQAAVVLVEHELVGIEHLVEAIHPEAVGNGVHHKFAFADFAEAVAAGAPPLGILVGESGRHGQHNVHAVFLGLLTNHLHTIVVGLHGCGDFRIVIAVALHDAAVHEIDFHIFRSKVVIFFEYSLDKLFHSGMGRIAGNIMAAGVIIPYGLDLSVDSQRHIAVCIFGGAIYLRVECPVPDYKRTAVKAENLIGACVSLAGIVVGFVLRREILSGQTLEVARTDIVFAEGVEADGSLAVGVVESLVEKFVL